MLQAVAASRGGIFALPWDPVSWGSVYSAHGAWLTATLSTLLPSRLPPTSLQDRAAEAAADLSQVSAGDTDDLAAAVDFSRAAYGYALLSGGLSSIYRYLHMQTLQRSVFDVIGGASVESNTQAAAVLAGIEVEDMLLAQWSNTAYRCALHSSPPIGVLLGCGTTPLGTVSYPLNRA